MIIRPSKRFLEIRVRRELCSRYEWVDDGQNNFCLRLITPGAVMWISDINNAKLSKCKIGYTIILSSIACEDAELVAVCIWL